MKKILSLIVLVAALASCEEDVKFNDPAVQALKNNELWKATSYSAVKNSDNSLTITATNGFETVTLRAETADPYNCNGTEVDDEDGDRHGCEYLFGYGAENMASYVLAADGIEMSYQTGNAAEPGEEEGAILIYSNRKYTNIPGGFISGEFYFNATDDDGEVVNFQQGVFYKIPITTAL
ncbi:MAG: DUF6252 family protein [Flavobacterium sp.]